MADQALRRPVVGQGDAALAALENLPAKKTEMGGGKAPAVQKQQGLLLPGQGLGESR